jgi:hypothetical protein
VYWIFFDNFQVGHSQAGAAETAEDEVGTCVGDGCCCDRCTAREMRKNTHAHSMFSAIAIAAVDVSAIAIAAVDVSAIAIAAVDVSAIAIAACSTCLSKRTS